jgi:hypothetical protein
MERDWDGGEDGGAGPNDGRLAAGAAVAGSGSRADPQPKKQQRQRLMFVFLTCPRMASHHPGDGFFVVDFLADKIKRNGENTYKKPFFSQLKINSIAEFFVVLKSTHR